MSIYLILRSALGLIIAYFGFGAVISLPVLSFGDFTLLEFCLVSFSLSVGCLTLLMLLLGLLETLTLQSLLLSMALVSAVSVCLWLYRLKRKEKPLKDLKLNWSGIFTLTNPLVLAMVGTIATLFFLILYHAILFPHILWDTLTEYAFLGKRIYLDGRIPLFSGSSGSVEWSGNYPMLAPLLYAWFNFSLGEVNDVLSRSIFPVFGLATLAATFALAKRLFNTCSGFFSVYVLAVTPMFLAHSAIGYVDIVLTFYFVVALYFLYTAREIKNPKHAFLAGFLGGIAAWTKYQGLSLVFIIVIYWLMCRARDRKVDSIFLIVLTGFAVSASPWYLRNWVLLGNPVYPNLFPVLDGRNLDGWLLSQNYEYWIGRWSVLLGTDRSTDSLIGLPITLLIRDNSLFSLGQDGVGLLLTSFGIPGLLFSLMKRKEGDLLLLDWVLIYFSLWFMLHYYFIRYLLPLFPALAILAGRLLNIVLSNGKAARAPEKLFVFLVMLVPLSTALFIPAGALALIGPSRTFKDYIFLRPFTPPSTEEALRHAIPADYALWEFINKETPGNAVILSFDHRLYYVDRSLVFADGTDMKELYLASDLSQAVDFVLRSHVTYIVVEPWYKEMPLWHKSVLFRNLDNTTYFHEVFDEWGYTVYKVDGAKP